MNLEPGSEVIVPGFTCVVVPNAIKYLGLKPIYVDIDPETYNIDVRKIEEKVSSKTGAIIAQHTFGIPADIDKIKAVSRKYKLFVIEDACHAIGSKYKGQEVGTLGDAAFFSSQWSKPITTGLGGWAVINNLELQNKMEEIYNEFTEPAYQDILQLRMQYLVYSLMFKHSLFWMAQNSFRKLSKFGLVLGSSSKEELEYRMPKGYKKKMSKWHKALLAKNLSRINESINHRRKITSIYESRLKERAMRLPDDYEPVYLRYPLCVKNKEILLGEAKKRKLELGDWFLSPVHPNLHGWDKVSYNKGMCPNAEEVCTRIINLPTHRGISEEDAEKIIELIVSNH
jgi:dTDP-4-amino-4,6-dideoxygalactose transaminase